MNIAVAVGAVCLLMNKAGDRHAWFQDNIFLNRLVDFRDRGGDSIRRRGFGPTLSA